MKGIHCSHPARQPGRPSPEAVRDRLITAGVLLPESKPVLCGRANIVGAMDKQRMQRLRETGLSYNEIAAKTGWNYSTVALHLRGHVPYDPTRPRCRQRQEQGAA